MYYPPFSSNWMQICMVISTKIPCRTNTRLHTSTSLSILWTTHFPTGYCFSYWDCWSVKSTALSSDHQQSPKHQYSGTRWTLCIAISAISTMILVVLPIIFLALGTAILSRLAIRADHQSLSFFHLKTMATNSCLFLTLHFIVHFLEAWAAQSLCKEGDSLTRTTTC